MQDIKDRFGEYWKNHFSTIGIVGMNEACLNLLNEDITTKVGQKFAISVLNFMRDVSAKYQEEDGDLFNIESTPAEGCTFRFAKSDKEKFPKIVSANDAGDPYYTNSSQLPVGFTDDVFEAIELQEKLQSLYTGGTSFHCFLGEAMPDIKAAKDLIKKIFTKYSLPYLSITPSFSICPVHHYISGAHEFCPKCDAEMGYTGD